MSIAEMRGTPPGPLLPAVNRHAELNLTSLHAQKSPILISVYSEPWFLTKRFLKIMPDAGGQSTNRFREGGSRSGLQNDKA